MERAGGSLDATLRLAGDFELWSRFFDHAPLFAVAAPLAGFRKHGEQKTGTHYDEYLAEAEAVCARAAAGRTARSRAGCAGRSGPRSVGVRWCGCRRGWDGPSTALGVIRPAPVLAWKSGWRVATDYLV